MNFKKQYVDCWIVDQKTTRHWTVFSWTDLICGRWAFFQYFFCKSVALNFRATTYLARRNSVILIYYAMKKIPFGPQWYLYKYLYLYFLLVHVNKLFCFIFIILRYLIRLKKQNSLKKTYDNRKRPKNVKSEKWNIHQSEMRIS